MRHHVTDPLLPFFQRIGYHEIMDNFRVYYSGGRFESGDSPEQVEKKVHDKIVSLGEVLVVEATALHPDEKEYSESNYVVSFEGEVTVEAETQVKAENQGYDLLSQFRSDYGGGFQKRGSVG